MTNIAIVVEDAATPEMLADVEMDEDDELFGLSEGTPLPDQCVGLWQRAARIGSRCFNGP